ncbi:methyltransferase-like protein C27D7.08c [Colletotrichum plurivorum]|uniref:Methyltransferase-like protein C27D7.08c n=1 Tax=Colletotrichum plurivorum TaxID=2175906 RepID=A0A8H6N9V0_9PEZI|nr:methyltransferase-like protein C27D7.08c [Colletotrichum plurivorum]
MTGKKRRRSDTGPPAPEDASPQKAIHHTERSHPNGAPPEPGPGADAYYRNLYATPPDFVQLGKQDPAFGAVLKNGLPDFNDPSAVMQLTKTLLKTGFGLEVELPDDRLCPAVMNRHNYILWLKGLMDSTSYDDPGRKVVGLDIGTGASAIYPLLGCAQRQWSFFATDIDLKSLVCASRNVLMNVLGSRISIKGRNLENDLVPVEDLGVTSLDFVMTNPPFYESDEDLLSSAAAKSRPPWTACTGAAHEMVTPGGEVAFVRRILDESLVLREKVGWYTSTFGKLSSLEAFVEILKEHKVDNYAVTEFVQGQKTRRWAVGWSFRAMRPSEEVARGMKASAWKKLFPPAVETELRLKLDLKPGEIGDRVRDVLSSLELLSWEWDREKLTGVGRASGDVWSRAWRRRKMREEREGKRNDPSAASEDLAFGFEISLRVGREETAVICRWREGHKVSVYESFCGFMTTRLSGVSMMGQKEKKQEGQSSANKAA